MTTGPRAGPFFEVGTPTHAVWVKDRTSHSLYDHEYRFYKGGVLVSTVEAPDSVILSKQYLVGAVESRDANSGGPGGPPGPLALAIPQHSYALPIESPRDLAGGIGSMAPIGGPPG